MNKDDRDALEFMLSEEQLLFKKWKDKCENISGEDLKRFKEWEKQFNSEVK